MCGVGAVLLLGAVACGSTAVTTPTPTATPAPSATATPVPTPVPTAIPVVGPGAADPVTAVEEVVDFNATGSEVAQLSGCKGTVIAQPCPMTLRLATRIGEDPFGANGGGPWTCRGCNGDTGTLTFSLISETGTTAYVSEVFQYSQTQLPVRYTVVEVASLWFVDDQDTGCTDTTIYSAAYDSLFYTFPPGQTRPPTPSC